MYQLFEHNVLQEISELKVKIQSHYKLSEFADYLKVANKIIPVHW